MLDTLESLLHFYDRGDLTTRDEEMERECRNCCILRDPPILRLGGHWIWRCVIGYLPVSYRIASTLYAKHTELVNYLNSELAKDMQTVETEADLADDPSSVRPGGFLLSQEDPGADWIPWVPGLWQRRVFRPSST